MTYESQSGDDLNRPGQPDSPALEANLSALKPREDRLDREQLMFLAGQASVDRDAVARWGRPAMLGAVAGAAAALLITSLVPLDSLYGTPTHGGQSPVAGATRAGGSDEPKRATQMEGRLYAVMAVEAYESLVARDVPEASDGDASQGPNAFPSEARPLMIRSYEDAIGPS